MTLGDPEFAINMVKVKALDENKEAFATRSVALPTMNKIQELGKRNNAVMRDSGNIFCNSNIVVPVGHVNSKLASCPTSYLQTPLPKPSPSVSNRGLVIVQVQNEQQNNAYRLVPVYDSVLKSYTSENDETFKNDIVYNLSNRKSENEDIDNNQLTPSKIEVKVDPSSHQLIHGYPPHTFLPEDEEEEEDEAEDEIDDPDYSPHDESDEGYRTNSSVASGSPSISSIESPAPVDEGCVVPKKHNEEVFKSVCL
jgi:hypothetical protein